MQFTQLTDKTFLRILFCLPFKIEMRIYNASHNNNNGSAVQIFNFM